MREIDNLQIDSAIKCEADGLVGDRWIQPRDYLSFYEFLHILTVIQFTN